MSLFEGVYNGKADEFVGLYLHPDPLSPTSREEFLSMIQNMRVIGAEDEYLDYLNKGITSLSDNNGHNRLGNRHLETPYSHTDDINPPRHYRRPFIGPVFEVEIPKVGRIKFYLPCSSIKTPDDGKKHNNPDVNRTKKGLLILNEKRNRLLLSDTGLLQFSDPSKFGEPCSSDYTRFTYALNEGTKTIDNLLEAFDLSMMIPIPDCCVHDYDFSIDTFPPNFDGPGGKGISALKEMLENSPQLASDLINICVDYYKSKMLFLTTSQFKDGISSGSPEYYSEIKSLVYTRPFFRTQESIEDYKSYLNSVLFNPQNQGLNFSIAIMECLASMEYFKVATQINKFERQFGIGKLSVKGKELFKIAYGDKNSHDEERRHGLSGQITDEKRTDILKGLLAIETGKASQRDSDEIHEVVNSLKLSGVSLD